MGTPWDADAYDTASVPQQEWAADVLARLPPLPPGATVLDVGCGSGRVTEALVELLPQCRVLAIDQSPAMVALAGQLLGTRARVWCQDALELTVPEPVDAIVSTAALHWVPDHDRLWSRLAAALRPGGVLEVQCGGAGNIAHVREAIDDAAHQVAPELIGFMPWTFATPAETEARMRASGFDRVRCWLADRPTVPADVPGFVRTSILAAHLDRLDPDRRDEFAEAVIARVRLPLDYVRLNISALR